MYEKNVTEEGKRIMGGQLKKLFAPVDMTEGRPWEKIVAFTVPLVIGNIAQQLYNTVDSIIVGRYVGDNALAAVGSIYRYFRGKQCYGFPVFRGKGEGGTLRHHRKLYHPDRHCLSHYHGAGTLCDHAYAGASAYAGYDH